MTSRRLSDLIVARPRLASVAILVAIVGLWQLLFGVVFTGVDVVATPSQIVSLLVEEPSSFTGHMATTAQEAALGFVFGVLAALLLAFVSLTSRVVEANVFHLAVVINSIPLIVLAPLLIIWFGSGLTPRIIIAAVAVFFVVLVNAVRGLKAVNRESQELFRVLGAGRLQLLWRLRVPSSLPFVLSALRIAAVASVLGAVIGEWVGASRGLGVVLIFSLYQFDTTRLWTAMVLLTAMALVAYGFIVLVERFALPWHESVRKPRLEVERTPA